MIKSSSEYSSKQMNLKYGSVIMPTATDCLKRISFVTNLVRSGQRPWSKYHLSFNLGYPNEYDLFHQRTGTALMIHGRCSSVGCFAMTDYFMDEIYILADAALANGQPNFQVHIFPFKLTDNNLAKVTDSRWLDFWKNLKQGYDLFERKFR